MPDDGGSVYAQEGTDLHDIMQDMFENEKRPPDYLGEQQGSIAAVTHEQVEALSWCYLIVDALIKPKDTFELEQWGDFPGIEGAGGTADVVVFNADGSYTIVDYKFGKGVPVDAHENKQLMFYAACQRELHGAAHTYHMHILQPRLDSHTSYSITDRELDTFVGQVQQAVEDKRDVYLTGPACKFCKGAAICPSKISLAQEVHQWRGLAQSDLPKALSMVDEIEEWAAAVRKTAHAALDKGANIQGWKLVQKVAHRQWADEDKVVHRKLYRRGVLIKDRITTKLISPAQAEKLLGKGSIQDMVKQQTETGTSLVRETDKRPPVHRGPRDLQSLANAISSNKNGEDR